MRACLACGEPTLGTRCPPCQAEQQRRVDERRGNSGHRGYDHRWQRQADAVRRDEKTCAICGTTDDLTVDHIIPKANGGTDHRSNLRVLCRRHNGQFGGPVRR